MMKCYRDRICKIKPNLVEFGAGIFPLQIPSQSSERISIFSLSVIAKLGIYHI